MVNLAKHVDQITFDYAERNDSVLLKKLMDTKSKVPESLRISDTCFTAVAFVGDGTMTTNHNHPHLDRNGVISVVITLGDDKVSGGRTLYFDGTSRRKKFSHSCPYNTCGEVIQSTPFLHGQYQIGPFDKVVHSGETWHGPRVVISFFLNRSLLSHFMQYGSEKYDKFLKI